MPFELIRRKEGEVSQKQEIRHKNVQISINDWGHLVIREFDEPQKNWECKYGYEKCIIENNGTKKACVDYSTGYQCEHYKTIRKDDEHMLVFDQQTTNRLINFIFSVRSTQEYKSFLKSILDKHIDLPF